MTTTWQKKTIENGSGNWAGSVPFNQFDPSTGIFLDAILTTAGTLGVSASIENLAPVAATINLGVAATIVASAPFIGTVGSVTPSVSGSVNLGGFQGTFDGVLDFGGPSGTVLPDIASTQTQYALVTPGSGTASPFLGAGEFDVSVSSYATSTVTGNGNLAVSLHGSTSADLSLQYDAITPKDPGWAASLELYNAGAGSDMAFMAAISIFQIINFVTTTPQVVSLPSQTTGWTGAASFNQFDPSLGTLVEIRLNVGNVVAGTFAVENLESVPAGIAMTENAALTLATPGSGVTVTAMSSDNAFLAAFDGAADFAGTSGQSDTIDGSLRSVASVATAAPSLNDGADLAAFTGFGTIALPVATSGFSVVTGPSNMSFEMTQHTGATVSVSYVYATPATTGQITPQFSGPPISATGEAPVTAGLVRVGLWAANMPEMTFTGGTPTLLDQKMVATHVNAIQGETFRVEDGADATIGDFSVTSGMKLDLTALLAGAPLAGDLSNLGAFVSASAHVADLAGGVDTILSVHGPGGAATLRLLNPNPIAVADLLNDHVLTLPGH